MTDLEFVAQYCPHGTYVKYKRVVVKLARLCVPDGGICTEGFIIGKTEGGYIRVGCQHKGEIEIDECIQETPC